MKIRTSFISNSSTSSFVISKKLITQDQLEKIRNHHECGEEYADTDSWDLVEWENTIKGSTIIDNFDFLAYLKKIGIPNEAFIEREGDNLWDEDRI